MPDLFESANGETAVIMQVAVPAPVDKPYSYKVPAGMEVQPGDYVSVPLGSRTVTGVVWGPDEGTPQKKLKTIVAKHDLPPMPQVEREFIEWVAHYTMTPLGAVLKMGLSVPTAMEKGKAGHAYKITAAGLKALSPPGRGLGEGAPPREKPSAVITERARHLRADHTAAEKKVWALLRDHRLEGLKFKRQVAIPPYIADFVCFDKMLVVEVDGGQHDTQQEYDERRTKFLEQRGFKVIRFWNNEVIKNIEGVRASLIGWLGGTPSPPPSPRGGEGVLSEGKGISPSKRKVLEALKDGKSYRAGELGVSAVVLKGLVQQRFVETTLVHSPAPCANPHIDRSGPALSPAQAMAAEHLCRQTGYHVTLIDGVTGAGKTEVYFEAVARALRDHKQVLILLPEIALSNAFLDRFQKRFGCAPALWHSSLTPAQRRKTWLGVAEGECRVVVGARSALFLPYADLGLIIVDEEHDPAYKQEDVVIYHARDMAVARAHLNRIPILLVSATPSLETMVNAWSGRYEHLHLPDRHGGATLPEIKLLDLRVDKPARQHFIAPTLLAAMEKTLARQEQILLFLNRRGYAPLTLCRTCGHRMECPRCTAWLVEHKSSGRLQCHHCGFAVPMPKTCPSCSDTDSLAACGPGVERIYDEVRGRFPAARTMVLASDTTDTHEKLKTALDEIRDRKIDIIVGTQIIAKGHHFPGLTLVGVIDADLGLGGGDLRAAERTYQLLHQVAGRAGREELKGTVYLQTFLPENRVMQALAGKGRDNFLDVEARERERAQMPPYGRLAGIIVSGRDEDQVGEVAKKLGLTAPQDHGIKTLGPAPAPMARLRGDHRKRLLVQADKTIALQKTIETWMATVKIPSGVRVQIDIDPQSFL